MRERGRERGKERKGEGGKERGREERSLECTNMHTIIIIHYPSITHLNVQFQWHRTNIGMEVEEAVCACSKPLSQVLSE